MAAGSQKDWSEAQSAFREFLKWLDEGVDSGGERYLEMRRRLVRYFDRKNCPSPDELADETLNRVARRLAEEEGGITNTSPAHYCYIVARFVFLEYMRRPDHVPISLDDASDFAGLGSRLDASSEPDDAAETKAKLLACLERCLSKLEPGHRELIVEYYGGDGSILLKNRLHKLAEVAQAQRRPPWTHCSIRACHAFGRGRERVCGRERKDNMLFPLIKEG